MSTFTLDFKSNEHLPSLSSPQENTRVVNIKALCREQKFPGAARWAARACHAGAQVSALQAARLLLEVSR